MQRSGHVVKIGRAVGIWGCIPRCSVYLTDGRCIRHSSIHVIVAPAIQAMIHEVSGVIHLPHSCIIPSEWMPDGVPPVAILASEVLRGRQSRVVVLGRVKQPWLYLHLLGRRVRGVWLLAQLLYLIAGRSLRVILTEDVSRHTHAG